MFEQWRIFVNPNALASSLLVPPPAVVPVHLTLLTLFRLLDVDPVTQESSTVTFDASKLAMCFAFYRTSGYGT